MRSVSLQERLQQLKKAKADLPGIFVRAQREATVAAAKAAQEATPPKEWTGRKNYIGAHTITGQLKEHWETDSQVEPEVVDGHTLKTELRNDMEYASYVNDGHRLDRHFVPGLYINEDSGLLEFDPEMAANQTGGLVVGTKTRYVKGEFMVDKAKEAYEDTLRNVLDENIRELLE